MLFRLRQFWGCRLKMSLLCGFKIFTANDKCQRADFDVVAFVEFDLALNPLEIDEGSVRGVAIANHELASLR
jgi:hypothetical protein